MKLFGGVGYLEKKKKKSLVLSTPRVPSQQKEKIRRPKLRRDKKSHNILGFKYATCHVTTKRKNTVFQTALRTKKL